MTELDHIHWIRRQIKADSRAIIGIGDDCAAVAWPKEKPVLFKTDMLLEGSCFTLDMGAVRIGRKAMSVNLSDIAAMAGQPTAAVVSLGLPRKSRGGLAEELFRGLKERADQFNVAIVGGDTNSWDGKLVVSIALIGEPTGRGPVRRNGAQPGDWIMVTGALGGSILGHHLDFVPRIREAHKLHQLVELKAMIDISDGLAVDLHHLCEESNCGAEMIAEQIPMSDAALRMKDGKLALEHALGDGEDFELLFAVSAEHGQRLLSDQPLREFGANLSRVGQFIAEMQVFLIQDGQRRTLPPLGYAHRFSE
jgi:thiamine-monophosphate kinase